MKTKKMILGSLLMVLSLSAALASSTCVQVNGTCFEFIPDKSVSNVDYNSLKFTVEYNDNPWAWGNRVVDFYCSMGSKSSQNAVTYGSNMKITPSADNGMDDNSFTLMPFLSNDGTKLILYYNNNEDWSPRISIFNYQDGNFNLLCRNHPNWSSDPTGANPSTTCTASVSNDDKYIALVYVPESGDNSLHSRCGTIDYDSGVITWSNGKVVNNASGISSISSYMSNAGTLIVKYIIDGNEYLQEGTFDGKGDITWNPVQGK